MPKQEKGTIQTQKKGVKQWWFRLAADGGGGRDDDGAAGDEGDEVRWWRRVGDDDDGVVVEMAVVVVRGMVEMVTAVVAEIWPELVVRRPKKGEKREEVCVGG
ncbi:hypothetical protein Tco_0759231 [Tanacetum coccineum]